MFRALISRRAGKDTRQKHPRIAAKDVPRQAHCVFARNGLAIHDVKERARVYASIALRDTKIARPHSAGEQGKIPSAQF
jgi:hypothetical protein